jgi:hypothetical protein
MKRDTSISSKLSQSQFSTPIDTLLTSGGLSKILTALGERGFVERPAGSGTGV